MAGKKRIIERLERTTVRHRGEDRHDPSVDFQYNYEPESSQRGQSQVRPVRRNEMRDRYMEHYRDEQRHEQRLFERLGRDDSDFYAGIDPRRRFELASGGMVREDRNAIANLSNTPIHREMVNDGYYSTPYIDDAVRGQSNLPDDNFDL